MPQKCGAELLGHDTRIPGARINGEMEDTSAESPDGWEIVELNDPGFTLAIHPNDRRAFHRAWPKLRAELARYRPDVLVLLPHRRIPTRAHKRHTRIRSFGLVMPGALDEIRRAGPPNEWAYRACSDALRNGISNGGDPGDGNGGDDRKEQDARAARFLVRELPPRRWRNRLRAWRDARREASRRIEPDLGGDPGSDSSHDWNREQNTKRVAAAAGGASDVSAVVIIPHAGPLEPLAALLTLLQGQRPPGVRISVGFDEVIGADHRALVERFGNAETGDIDFWAVEPAGGGPYAIREFLARRAPEPWIIFQDSDDLPCVDRLPTLLAAIRKCPVDVLGSWELQVNDRRRRLTAVRFPIDASAAVRRDGETAQLHPTTIARAAALRRMGGFSTSHRFAADRELQLRSAFDFDLRNLDRVLYVRSRRDGTLSTAPESGMKSAAREVLRERWHQAYLRVRDGGVPASESGLGPVHAEHELRFTDLRSGEIVTTRFDSDPSATPST